MKPALPPIPLQPIISSIKSIINNISDFIEDNTLIHMVFSLSSKFNTNELFKSIEIVKEKQNIPIVMGYNNNIQIDNEINIYYESDKLNVKFSHFYYDAFSIFKLLNDIYLQMVSNKCETFQYKIKVSHTAIDYTQLFKHVYLKQYSINNIPSSIQIIQKLQQFSNIEVIVDARIQKKCTNEYGNHRKSFFITKHDNFIKKLKASRTIVDFPVRDKFSVEPFVLFNSYLKFKLPLFIDEFISMNSHEMYPVILITPISNVSGKSAVLCNKKGFEFFNYRKISFL
jgi:hypothetical protein